MNVSIILVSEQTIPNILFLKDFENQWDSILLLSTKKMQDNNKDTIIRSFFPQKQSESIIVDENALFEVTNKLEQYFSEHSYDRILVNITGGTKTMSIATYNFFKNKANSEIYYLPIKPNDSYLQFFETKVKKIPLKCKLDLKDYFKATGNEVKIKPIENEELFAKLANQIFEKYEDNFETISTITENFRVYRSDEKKRRKYMQEPGFKKNWKDIINYLGISEDDLNTILKNYEKKFFEFFSGGWLEIYVYELIKQSKNINDIACNVILNEKKPNQPHNELDVAFMLNNRLHMVECKTGDVNKELNDIIYKVAYLKKHFSLDVKSYLVVINLGNNISQEKIDRAKFYGLNFIDYKSLKEKGLDNFFEQV